MKIKNVVKVMNFQSLLHMDKALKEAEKYKNVGDEITKILEKIIYNKNLILDKKILVPDSNLPELNVYIANDYGFCGNFNSEISRNIRKDTIAMKIIIGKKILYSDNNTLLKIDKEQFHLRFNEIQERIEEGLKSLSYSRVNVYYNHYYSMSSFELKKIQLFPTPFKGEYYDDEDFVAETDMNTLLSSLISFYISYQIKMCESISVAAENVMRSQVTSSALDKIEEKEEEDKRDMMKQRKEKSVLKSVENFKKLI